MFGNAQAENSLILSSSLRSSNMTSAAQRSTPRCIPVMKSVYLSAIAAFICSVSHVVTDSSDNQFSLSGLCPVKEQVCLMSISFITGFPPAFNYFQNNITGHAQKNVHAPKYDKYVAL